MVQDFIQLIIEKMTIISRNQKCQAFDPMMIFKIKTEGIVDNSTPANTSCLAPAYVLLEGSRGKRYLCDYHYASEKDITTSRTPEDWPKIEKFIIDEREEISKTFEKNVKSTYTIGKVCWCKKRAYVIVKLYDGNETFFCNFHFRKYYYRCISNKFDFEKFAKIVDERCQMEESIIEESNNILIF